MGLIVGVPNACASAYFRNYRVTSSSANRDVLQIICVTNQAQGLQQLYIESGLDGL
ncbi:hypothetical protein ABBQ32_013530 [Trebouxia sp. C0010 RCD-2024]